MPLLLKVVSRAAAAVLDELTADLDVGDSRKIDRGLGFMGPGHVGSEHLERDADRVAADHCRFALSLLWFPANR